ncbi:MAG: nucleotide exchange factor GrpE [Defluviitaleaceae bacterium]|nr:nucleotide exchange factor GrpE [Defluviitaleaceae bacterium]
MKNSKKAEDDVLVQSFQEQETSDVEEVFVEEEKEENEFLDKYQRCLAEFDNYRKRTTKELASRYDDGIRATCEKLLPITDNFERALAAFDDKENSFYKGIEMIARQFDSTLEELGIKSIEIEPGGAFDTNLHYAVAHIEDENFGESTVVEILQKGYVLKERVIRPAMVKVAN